MIRKEIKMEKVYVVRVYDEVFTAHDFFAGIEKPSKIVAVFPYEKRSHKFASRLARSLGDKRTVRVDPMKIYFG
jgi:hypothetical protein